MFYELIRAIVQKIFQDKILAGLVIVGLLAIFVGGFGGNVTDRIASGPREDRKGQKAGAEKSLPSAAKEAKAETSGKAAAAKPSVQEKLEPALAAQFVGWWIGDAMDFNPATVIQKRQQAMTWIVPEVAQSYQAAFWPSEIADGVCSGRIRGSFTPTSVQAVASNPDGSIVVNVTGNLTLQQGPRPAVQILSTDYLVKREAGGLRIAGLFNRSTPVPSSSIY
jgi:hypothetical protein